MINETKDYLILVRKRPNEDREYLSHSGKWVGSIELAAKFSEHNEEDISYIWLTRIRETRKEASNGS